MPLGEPSNPKLFLNSKLIGSAKGITVYPLRVLTLVKHPHTFIFRCAVGDEAALLDAIADLVKARELTFDWFDAAILSHQLGQQMGTKPK